MTFQILALAFVAGLYMAWNIGANDAANGMATAVGSRAISLRQALVIAGILDFVGAAFIGSHVCDTIRKGIVDPSIMQDPHTVSLGLLAALVSASLWVFLSTWRQLPVSTTHSIVGAMIGFGLISNGVSAVQWGKVVGIALSWVISPLFAMVLSMTMLRFIRSRIFSRDDMFQAALLWSPFFAGITFFVVFASLLMKTPLGTKLGMTSLSGLGVGLGAAFAGGFGARAFVRRTISQRGEFGVEELFRRLQIFTSCYVALAHGANDVANAMGPLAGIYLIYVSKAVNPTVPVPFFLLALGGAGIAAGVAMWGYRVIETMGERITTLTNTRGFSVDFGTATCVLLAAKLGLPVSTTHAVVGAVIGVGLARGVAAVDFRVVFRICLYWVVTLPVSAVSAMLVYKLLRAVYG